MNDEVWKPIAGFETHEVSSLGRVRSLGGDFVRDGGRPYRHKGRLMALSPNVSGYLSVTVGGLYRGKRFLVHRMVAEVFLLNPEGRTQVNHKNLDILDNRVENLEWATRQENINHGVANGRYAKLPAETIIAIHRTYHSGEKTMAELVRQYGVTIKVVSFIVRGLRHTHLTKDLPVQPQFTENTGDFTIEEYRPLVFRLPGYQVSSHGRVLNPQGEEMTLHDDGRGYKSTHMGYVHELVARTFLPNPHGHRIVHHLDHNKSNNHASNLQWCTQSYNSLMNCRRGGLKRHHGASNKNSKLTDEQVLEIRSMHKDGITSRKISQFLGIPGTTVHMIVNNQTWKNLLPDSP